MHSLSESDIRTALVNASVRERKSLHLPPDFDEIGWAELDYLGWRDPKSPTVGYLVIHRDEHPVGLMLRAGAIPPRTRPQCALCEDISLPNEVVLFSARRAGPAGRKGDTVGTLICANFECSRNVRRLPSSAMAGDDPERVRLARIDGLRERVQRFVARVASAD
ncbi:FBP domain-containing protein [Gordonia sp. NPDC003504]